MFRFCLLPLSGTKVILWGTLILISVAPRSLHAQSDTTSLELLQRQYRMDSGSLQ